MAAVTIDASVVDGSNNHIWPNPLPVFGVPVDITEVSAGALSNPTDIAVIADGEISAPIDILELAAGVIGVPVDITEVAAGTVAVPVDITELAEGTIAIPVDVAEVAAGTIAVPNAITSTTAPGDSPPYALNHARILYDNLLSGSSVAASVGSNGNYTLIPNTAQRWTWTATTSDNIIFTIPANVDIDTVCISAHNLSDIGATIEVLYDDDATGAFTSITATQTPTTNNAIMFHVAATVDAKRIQVLITGVGGGSAYIGSIYAGVALQMQRPYYGGSTPSVLAKQADYYSSSTESGNYIGVEVRRRALKSNASWKHLTDTWYRAYFVPFLDVAESLPFVYAWNLSEHPTDVIYCKNITNIEPSYMGLRDLMQVDIPLIGII